MLGVIFKLRSVGGGTLPATTGQLVHAALLGLIRHELPALAARLHDAPGLRPFTVGALEATNGSTTRTRDQLRIPAGADCWFRVTSSDAELTQCLGRWLKAPPPSLELGPRNAGVAFEIQGLAGPTSGHPLAASTTCRELTARWMAKSMSVRDIEIRVRTPATFREHDINIPLPLASRVFDGLLKKWRNAAGPNLADQVEAPIAALLVASGFPEAGFAVGSGRPGPMDPGVDAVVLVKHLDTVHTPPPWRFSPPVGLQIGFTGRVVYTVREAPSSAAAPFVSAARRAVALLAEFAFFAGIGAHTAFGMGQVDRPVRSPYHEATNGR